MPKPKLKEIAASNDFVPDYLEEAAALKIILDAVERMDSERFSSRYRVLTAALALNGYTVDGKLITVE